MYSLKVFLLLNCARQGDLNSKWMSLNFLKVSQSLLYYCIPPPLIFPLQVNEACQFHLSSWKVYLSKVSAGKHTIVEVYAALIFAILIPPPQNFSMVFLSEKLINSAKSHALQS